MLPLPPSRRPIARPVNPAGTQPSPLDPPKPPTPDGHTLTLSAFDSLMASV